MLNESQKREIVSAFDGMCHRAIGPIYEEVSKADRRAVDTIVFDDLGLTQGERDAVYEAVVKLVEARLKKAESLNPKTKSKTFEVEA
jgi:phage portal protein BeeE